MIEVIIFSIQQSIGRKIRSQKRFISFFLRMANLLKLKFLQHYHVYNYYLPTISMNEQQNPTFSQALIEYITKALSIWPGLKVSLTHLSEAGAPPQGSPIPKKNYRDMTSQQFIKQIASDMHDYIMEHDIKSEHIEEYLDDILAILSTQEENIMTIRYMANQLTSLVEELPEQKFDRLYKFRHLYEEVQANAGSIIHQHQGDDSESDQEGEQDDGEMNYEDEDENKISEEPPQLMSQEQQQELEDDGWVVVKKKNNKK